MNMTEEHEIKVTKNRRLVHQGQYLVRYISSNLEKFYNPKLTDEEIEKAWDEVSLHVNSLGSEEKKKTKKGWKTSLDRQCAKVRTLSKDKDELLLSQEEKNVLKIIEAYQAFKKERKRVSRQQKSKPRYKNKLCLEDSDDSLDDESKFSHSFSECFKSSDSFCNNADDGNVYDEFFQNKEYELSGDEVFSGEAYDEKKNISELHLDIDGLELVYKAENTEEIYDLTDLTGDNEQNSFDAKVSGIKLETAENITEILDLTNDDEEENKSFAKASDVKVDQSVDVIEIVYSSEDEEEIKYDPNDVLLYINFVCKKTLTNSDEYDGIMRKVSVKKILQQEFEKMTATLVNLLIPIIKNIWENAVAEMKIFFLEVVKQYVSEMEFILENGQEKAYLNLQTEAYPYQSYFSGDTYDLDKTLSDLDGIFSSNGESDANDDEY